MRLFGFRRPRPFMHHYIYVDERRERLRSIERRARRELGMLPPEATFADDLHGAFSRRCDHLRRRRRGAGSFLTRSTLTRILAIVLLLLLARWLMVGALW